MRYVSLLLSFFFFFPSIRFFFFLLLFIQTVFNRTSLNKYPNTYKARVRGRIPVHIPQSERALTDRDKKKKKKSEKEEMNKRERMRKSVLLRGGLKFAEPGYEDRLKNRSDLTREEFTLVLGIYTHTQTYTSQHGECNTF